MPGDDLTPIFRVVRRRDGEVYPCQNAHEVALFLWGRDIYQYAVFVRSRRVVLKSSEIGDIEATVEAAYAQGK